MSKVRSTSLIVLCAALAACSDDVTSRTLTAPDVRGDVGEAPAGDGFSYTMDGPFDLAVGGEDMTAQLAGAQTMGAQLAASSQSASGPRTSGHVGFPAGVLPPAIGIASEKYSYTALGTNAGPLSAKGQYEIQYTATTGTEVRIHGEVSCVIVFGGNTARASGPITKVWRNGVPSPITANTHAFWVVVDLGEGAGQDLVSLVRFSNAGIAQNFCTNGFGSTVFPNQEGNIQVEP